LKRQICQRSPVAAQRGLPERRRHDVFHEAAGDHFLALDLGRHRRFVDFLLADAGRVHVGLVGQVHQVVDHQAVLAVDVVQAATVGPFRILGPFQVVDGGRIGQRLVARPDPDEAVALFDRVAADAGEAAHALARHADRLAFAAHFQAVVAAHQVAVTDKAQRQRRAAVRAEILDRGDLAFLAAIKHDFFAADLAAQRFSVDLVGRAGHVPGVLREHACLLLWIIFSALNVEKSIHLLRDKVN
jgi:hypothetical protein